ncbi:peptidoglycan DD-metalloendopeptidase family protein [Marivibrio halodurans]|uniref:Peptidoglycan DD-metalloendopeptidase family protein n=1 Tax=Marivibrio halodurans TaxID=2039722 RepID=A0A8J7S1J9_9PROT|nr:peptidoglycan DD-metalloendopeptidase family protein [Marivibrio halodurans]MBP5856918.1 peptidoglycan DD-metalloendopeptidase family protein [Marivibrio halodurans]
MRRLGFPRSGHARPRGVARGSNLGHSPLIMSRLSAHMRALSLLALLIVSAVACARDDSGPRVRIYQEGQAESGAAGTATSEDTGRVVPGSVPVEISPDGVHSVTRGQTLYSISRAYNAPLRAMIVENGLEPPYRLEVGQRLRVPQAKTYQVRAGDTVYGVSRDFGVSMNELVRVNGIEPPYTIKVGQRLLIPGQVSRQASAATSPTTADSPSPREGTSPGGDPTAAEIARRAAEALDEENAAPATPPPRVAPDRPFRMAEDGQPRPRLKPEAPRRTLASVAQPPPRAASTFLRPVEGRVVSRFGPKGKGLHNDGMNIAAPRGTAVRAAENGVVAYAGTELKGFGQGVLIKHADGYMTFYAHNDAVLVSRGQRVARGQTIARLGSTGNVDTPQLHFQVRKGRQALDPEKYLGG